MAQREGDLINQRNGSKSRMIAPVTPEHGNQAEQDEAGDLYGIFDAVNPVVIGALQQRVDEIGHVDQCQNAENHLRREMK